MRWRFSRTNPPDRIERRRNRETGTMVSVWRPGTIAEDDCDSARWFTICEDHGSLVGHPTRKLAMQWLSHPLTWCEECQKNKQ